MGGLDEEAKAHGVHALAGEEGQGGVDGRTRLVVVFCPLGLVGGKQGNIAPDIALGHGGDRSTQQEGQKKDPFRHKNHFFILSFHIEPTCPDPGGRGKSLWMLSERQDQGLASRQGHVAREVDGGARRHVLGRVMAADDLGIATPSSLSERRPLRTVITVLPFHWRQRT